MTGIDTRGRGACPGPFACSRGVVTVELAASLIAMAVFFSMLVGGLGGVGMQFTLNALARDAARSASLASDAEGASRAARAAVGEASGIDVTVESHEGFVRVSLRRPVHLLGIDQALTLRAEASAFEESPW